jgi:hypothetical protein
LHVDGEAVNTVRHKDVLGLQTSGVLINLCFVIRVIDRANCLCTRDVVNLGLLYVSGIVQRRSVTGVAFVSYVSLCKSRETLYDSFLIWCKADHIGCYRSCFNGESTIYFNIHSSKARLSTAT